MRPEISRAGLQSVAPWNTFFLGYLLVRAS